MKEFIIGNIVRIINGSEFQINVTHVSKDNKFDYNNLETITLKNNTVTLSLQKQVKAYIMYRDSYNRLVCNIELNG